MCQVRGTIFNEIDDEKLHKQIDFSDFEERFKIGLGNLQNGAASEVDGIGLVSMPSKRSKKQENISLLEHTRLRNIGEYHRIDVNHIIERQPTTHLFHSNLSPQTGHAH